MIWDTISKMTVAAKPLPRRFQRDVVGSNIGKNVRLEAEGVCREIESPPPVRDMLALLKTFAIVHETSIPHVEKRGPTRGGVPGQNEVRFSTAFVMKEDTFERFSFVLSTRSHATADHSILTDD